MDHPVWESCNVDWMPLRAMFNDEDLPVGQYNKESEVGGNDERGCKGCVGRS